MVFDPKDSHGPIDPGPMSIELPGKTAMLLVKLAQEVGAQTPGQVVAQALGLMETVRQAKARGQRIVLRDPQTGREVDLAL